LDLTAQTSLSFEIGENSEFECIAIPDAMTKNVSKSKGFPETVKHLADFVGALPLLAQDDVQACFFASTRISLATGLCKVECGHKLA
jgi:hypothetical protein